MTLTNWVVTLVNTQEPFQTVQKLVKAPTVSDAFDEKYHGLPKFWPRSASFHSVDTDQYAQLSDVLSEI
jgi:hypothetical protein